MMIVAIDRNKADFETNFLEIALHVAIDRNSEGFDSNFLEMTRHVAIDQNREDFETNFHEMACQVVIDRNREDFGADVFETAHHVAALPRCQYRKYRNIDIPYPNFIVYSVFRKSTACKNYSIITAKISRYLLIPIYRKALVNMGQIYLQHSKAPLKESTLLEFEAVTGGMADKHSCKCLFTLWRCKYIVY